MTEEKLSRIIAAITTSNDATREQMKKKMTDRFHEVKTRLDSLIDAVLNKVLEATTVQKVGLINTRTQIQNVQIPSHAIKTNSEDLNTSLQKLQDLSVDINVISTQTLVQFQSFSNQELADREHIIGDHLLRS